MEMHKARRLLKGLTLIEGTIIAVVLLVILAVVWPVTACACGSPKLACLATVHTVGKGILMYTTDNDGLHPIADTWMDGLKPYLKEDRVFHDPDGVKSGGYGRAFRRNLSTVKVDDVNEPVNYIMYFDSTLMARNANSELWSLPRPGRHKDWDVVVFDDGHAKGFSTKAPSASELAPLDVALRADDSAGPKRKPAGSK